MIHPWDEIPDCIQDEVQNRIGAGGDGNTLIVDEANREFIVGYAEFTEACKREYRNACDERGEESIKVYQITIDHSGIQLTRYQSAKGMNAEKIWRKSVQ